MDEKYSGTTSDIHHTHEWASNTQALQFGKYFIKIIFNFIFKKKKKKQLLDFSFSFYSYVFEWTQVGANLKSLTNQ